MEVKGYGQNLPGNKLGRTVVIYQVNSKKYFQHFGINENKSFIFKNDVTSYDLKTSVHLWSSSDTNEKWRNGKLVKPSLRTIYVLAVLIMSCGLVTYRILSTKGKRYVEHVANIGERCVQVLVSKPEGKRLLVRPRHR